MKIENDNAMKETLLIEKIDSLTAVNVANFLHKCNGNDVVIEFCDESCCPHYIVPIFALLDMYREKGGIVELRVPSFSAIARAMLGEKNDCILGKVCRFSSMDEYLDIFTKVQMEVLKLPDIAKGFKVSFGWCISEIMDNVIQHSGVGIGYIMVQYVSDERLLKTCVFDLGKGICASLRGSKFSTEDAEESIKRAIEPNVTSGNGQGNGLYGLREIVKQSKNGRLQITSSGAKYTLLAGAQQKETTERVKELPGFPGTTAVDFQVVLDDPLSIDSVFNDAMPSVDIWLEDHELDESTISLKVLEIVPGTISREYGREIRHVVENLIDNEHKHVVVDFDGVDMCSSAFVDEFVGKLLVKYQFVNFSRMIRLQSLKGLPAMLINHSIKQRLSEESLSTPEVKDSTGSVNMGQTGPMPVLNAANLEADDNIEKKPTVVEKMR